MNRRRGRSLLGYKCNSCWMRPCMQNSLRITPRCLESSEVWVIKTLISDEIVLMRVSSPKKTLWRFTMSYTRRKIGHFGDVLPSPSLVLAPKRFDAFALMRCLLNYGHSLCLHTIRYKLVATLRWFTAGVQSASLYDNFRKPANYVIMTSLMTS